MDLKGHTGTTMLLGSGLIFSGPWKSKLVTHSSTESEVVGVYDILRHILWTKKFLDDQGLQLCKTIIHHTTPVQFCWRKADATPVAVALNTWTFSTIILPIM